MEISALAPSGFAPPPTSEARTFQAATEHARGKGSESNAVAPGSLRDNPEQSAPARADALRSTLEDQRKQAEQSNIAGRIQFDMEEGSRVMKVLDSKDVLIYQVPSKGELTLIKAEEAASRRMLVRA
jgi:hypothetical protein